MQVSDWAVIVKEIGYPSVVGLILLLYLTRSITKRLDDLTEAINKLTDGNAKGFERTNNQLVSQTWLLNLQVFGKQHADDAKKAVEVEEGKEK